MRPRDIVVADWLERPRDRPLAWYEAAHRQHVLVDTAEVYLMGRGVVTDAPLEQILDVGHAFDPALVDCWYVFALAGDIRKAWQYMPQPLPWVCFERRRTGDELHFRSIAPLMRRFGVGLTA